MSDAPYGWTGTDSTGRVSLYRGKLPDGLSSVVEHDTLEDYQAALDQLRNPPPTLDQAKAAQIATLAAACSDAITAGGFASSALGAVHGYPLDRDSQLNLSASVTASLLPGLDPSWTTQFWCADSSGTWTFAPHTAAQIQQVGRDGMAVVLAARLRLQNLSASVTAAATPAAVAAVAWA